MRKGKRKGEKKKGGQKRVSVKAMGFLDLGLLCRVMSLRRPQRKDGKRKGVAMRCFDQRRMKKTASMRRGIKIE